MVWHKRSGGKTLTAAQKREVRKIVQSTEPKQWEALFEIDPCLCLELSTDECKQSTTFGILDSPVGGGGAPNYGEAVCHRTRGDLWIQPRLSADLDCEEALLQYDDMRLRVALVKRQLDAAGNFEAFDPWSQDWFQGVGVLWRQEHLFFSKWSVTSFAETTIAMTIPQMGIYDPVGSGSTLSVRTFTESCNDAHTGFPGWGSILPCTPGYLVSPASCTRTQDQPHPFRVSSRHLPRNVRVKDGETIRLVIGWARDCTDDPAPGLTITGGWYGEVSESTPES